MPGLGRGLTALLSDSNIKKVHTDKDGDKYASRSGLAAAEHARAGDKNIAGMVAKLSIDSLKASVYQPRKNFNEDNLRELADSIKKHGLLEPLLVKKGTEGNYEVICGERRLRACRLAGVREVPCLIRDELEQQNAYAIALVENIQREDLNPLELAEALSQMISECGLSQEELARNLGKSRSSVTNILRINHLPAEIKAMISSGALDLGHAKVLMGLDPELQKKAAALVVKKALSVRQTEAFVKSVKEHGEAAFSRKTVVKPEDFTRLEKTLNSRLPGIKCSFSVKNSDKGKLTLAYSSKEQLDKILAILGIERTPAGAAALDQATVAEQEAAGAMSAAGAGQGADSGAETPGDSAEAVADQTMAAAEQSAAVAADQASVSAEQIAAMIADPAAAAAEQTVAAAADRITETVEQTAAADPDPGAASPEQNAAALEQTAGGTDQAATLQPGAADGEQLPDAWQEAAAKQDLP